MVNSARTWGAAALVALILTSAAWAQPAKQAPTPGSRSARRTPTAAKPAPNTPAAAKPAPNTPAAANRGATNRVASERIASEPTDSRPATQPLPAAPAPPPPAAAPAPPAAASAKPSAAEALKLQPNQTQIDYDVPDEQAVAQCTLESVNAPNASGWEVRDAQNHVLRRFLDTNADNKLDQWCYFKNGIEVYREIDSDFNRKIDQYRWLGTAGIRWALDNDEDGTIDSWKVISPEEVSEELVAALSARDAARLRSLLLTDQELGALKLGARQAEELEKKLADTTSGLEELVRTQEFVKPDAHWVNFGSTRPGVVPAGTDGLAQDLLVYENAVAVVEAEGGHDQIVIGTMIRTGDAWRLISLPRSLTDMQTTASSDGFFFPGPLAPQGGAELAATGGLSPEIQDLINQIEQVDADLAAAATLAALAPLNARRADLLERLVGLVTSPEDKVMWTRQLAETVSAAVQAGGFPDGLARLDALYQRLAAEPADLNLVSYVRFRYLMADYSLAQQSPGNDFPKVQQKWKADLEAFIAEFGTTDVAADAMLSLAIAQEFDGEDEKAISGYGRIVAEFPDTPGAAKAAGAKRRLESVGKPLDLQGKDRDGTPVSIASLRGKVVIIHYWATWCVPCKQDIPVLKEMQRKYGADNVALIGINVNDNPKDFADYVAENPMDWPQLYEPGGLDSPLANALGIQTLPTMFLLDKEGKVVDRNLLATEVDAALRELLR